VDCDIDNLLAARKALNEAAEVSVKISVNDMVVKATAAALMAEPDVNGYFEVEGCRYFSTADICVAVAVDGGLVTPVIHDVQNLGLADISRKTTDLASRARAGTLDPSEYAGGSFTVSNLGMFGIREFAAVINPPQSAILAVGAGEQRPVVKNGELAVATVMTVTLSADHRIVDGALGAKWLQAFKRAIEQPVTMLL
jgi:pyruvate dehydrogenase E2 component (dihydrolipoamide acetyltransferase)